MTIAFLFPGQGSQSVGMLAELGAQHASLRDAFAECSDAIGVDLWQLAQHGPDVELNRTELTQPALLAAGVGVYRAWRAAGGAAAHVLAGHSLGEYSALVCAEAISLTDAARLVHLRGKLMQSSVPEGTGAMAAVLNAELSVIEAACQQAELQVPGEVIAPANLNAPGQIVISGHASALERALKLLAEAGVRKAIKLPVSVPSHCELMRDAALKLDVALAAITLHAPRIPVLHNVSAGIAQNTSEIRSLLVQQLYSRVRWIECVQALAAPGSALSCTRALECGPGKALSGMVKRIAPELSASALANPAEFDAALQLN